MVTIHDLFYISKIITHPGRNGVANELDNPIWKALRDGVSALVELELEPAELQHIVLP